MSRPNTPSCARCGKPATDAHTPFCSQGCRDRDLLQWLSDGYRLPGRAIEEEAGENAAAGLDSERDAAL